jgi:hypothetical protein
MATLQSPKQFSAPVAKSRLKQTTPQALPQAPVRPQLVSQAFEALPASAGAVPAASESTARPFHERLSEVEQRQLLLQAVKIYPGWELVSIQHRPESDLLIAYLVRTRDNVDPTLAVREGRAMQILMDATGDLRIKRPRRQRTSLLAWLLHWLSGIFSGSEFSVPA